MVGCKDDPSHKLSRNLCLLPQSPTQDEQDTRVELWLKTVSQPSPISLQLSTHPSPCTAHNLTDPQAPDLDPFPLKKSTSTRSGNAPTEVNKRERLMFLNPPIKFFTPGYLSVLGKNIPALLKNLQVNYIESDDKGFIPQALKARIPPQTPNKSKPKIRATCFADNTRYSEDDYDRIWLTITDVVKNADKCRHMGYHASHWVSHIVSPMLNLVSKLKSFTWDRMCIRALDIQTVNIDLYSSDTQFKSLDKRIDCALGLHLSEEETLILTRGVYEIEDAVDTAWISAEFEKRRIEHYSVDLPVLAIEIEGDQWGLYIVYADGNGIKFVSPVSLGDTSSLQGCFKLLDGLCRCADWGVGKYQSWFREQILDHYTTRK